MTYIALHVEKWLYGSTKMKMEHDEIACFTYILARAAVTGADPPGQIYYFSDEHLACQLQVPQDLLQRTLEKCVKFRCFLRELLLLDQIRSASYHFQTS